MKKTKKGFSISFGGIVLLLVIALLITTIIISVVRKNTKTSSKRKEYKSTNNVFMDSELVSVDENPNYKKAQKISQKDLKIGKIYCGMKLSDMKPILGDADEIYNGQGDNYLNVNYQCYKYYKHNLLIDLDKATEKIKRISYYGNDLENNRGLKIGSSISEVISKYHSEKQIGKYENNKGIYKILYNSDDAFDYIYNGTTKNKSLGYMYEYMGKVYIIEYIENDIVLKFEFLDHKVNRIYMSQE